MTNTCFLCEAEIAPNRKWCSERCRKKSLYGGECVDCGEPTSYGSQGVNQRCNKCAAFARTKWTHARILTSILEWAERFGSPPTAEQWNPPQARAVGHHTPWKVGEYPPLSTVQQRFGSWNAAIEAAGFPPLKGQYRTASRAEARAKGVATRRARQAKEEHDPEHQD